MSRAQRARRESRSSRAICHEPFRTAVLWTLSVSRLSQLAFPIGFRNLYQRVLDRKTQPSLASADTCDGRQLHPGKLCMDSLAGALPSDACAC